MTLDKMVAIGSAIILSVVLIAVATPAIQDNLQEQQVNTLEMTLDERQTIVIGIHAEVTDIKPSQRTINMSFYDLNSGDFNTTGEMSLGSSTNITMSGETIVVKPIEFMTTDSVIVEFNYPYYIGTPQPIQILLQNIIMTLVFLEMALIGVGVYIVSRGV